MPASPMDLAIEMARTAASIGEVPVGAVIVDPLHGNAITMAANCSIAGHDPTAHAEIVAIRQAARRLENYRLTGLHMYVTLEPCAMCASAISHARIARLVYAARDVKGGAVESGPRLFEQATCHWRPEVEQDEARAEEAGELLRAFFRARRNK